MTKFSIPNEHGGKKDLGPAALRNVQRKSQRTNQEFTALVECTLTTERYVELLRARGLLKSPAG